MSPRESFSDVGCWDCGALHAHCTCDRILDAWGARTLAEARALAEAEASLLLSLLEGVPPSICTFDNAEATAHLDEFAGGCEVSIELRRSEVSLAITATTRAQALSRLREIVAVHELLERDSYEEDLRPSTAILAAA